MTTAYKISTVAQHRSDRQHAASSVERTLRVIDRIGQSVNLAVERFITVGETIADDNPEIKQDMYDACKEARTAGKLAEYDINCKMINSTKSTESIYIYIQYCVIYDGLNRAFDRKIM